jgi:hypothetical protein
LSGILNVFFPFLFGRFGKKYETKICEKRNPNLFLRIVVYLFFKILREEEVEGVSK